MHLIHQLVKERPQALCLLLAAQSRTRSTPSLFNPHHPHPSHQTTPHPTVFFSDPVGCPAASVSIHTLAPLERKQKLVGHIVHPLPVRYDGELPPCLLLSRSTITHTTWMHAQDRRNKTPRFTTIRGRTALRKHAFAVDSPASCPSAGR